MRLCSVHTIFLFGNGNRESRPYSAFRKTNPFPEVRKLFVTHGLVTSHCLNYGNPSHSEFEEEEV